MKRKNILVLAILLMTIGFATVSTTLFINGNTNVASNTQDFDVYFSRVFENGVEKNTLIQDKTHITFEANLKEINEVYELKYEVTNASKNYDVSITINVPNGNEYLRVTNDFDTSNLLARTTREGVLTLKVIKGVTEEVQFPIEITITVNAVERTSLGSDTIRSENVYKENILHGTDPVLKEELIPVTIADNGEVTYADTHTEWYKYENKEWANAVILVNEPSKEYKMGDTILEEDIESYFVWIPKYKYKLFDMGNYTTSAGTSKPSQSIAKTIEIEFTLDETTNTESSCVSPKVAGESGTCEVGKWMTHPAFQNFDVTGLWVGKFETGNDNGIIVKPNVKAWEAEKIAIFFKTSYNYKRELDSHMMKNTEWGAVAYLSHSKYGINDEIRINNNSNNITGCAAADGTDQSGFQGTTGTTEDITQPYNTETGYKATTTGNITGIYDMSGGAWEYMAAYSGVGQSDLTTEELITYAKYFDQYPSDSSTSTWNYRILGDATGEMGPFYSDTILLSQESEEIKKTIYYNSWYEDHSDFLRGNDNHVWFNRGGKYNYGNLAGQFQFDRNLGDRVINGGFRLILALK